MGDDAVAGEDLVDPALVAAAPGRARSGVRPGIVNSDVGVSYSPSLLSIALSSSETSDPRILRSGAISANGARTNRRSWSLGWGRTSPGPSRR